MGSFPEWEVEAGLELRLSDSGVRVLSSWTHCLLPPRPPCVGAGGQVPIQPEAAAAEEGKGRS